MATACLAQLTFAGEECPKPIVARFDAPHFTSRRGSGV